MSEIHKIVHNCIKEAPEVRGSKHGLALETHANWSSLAGKREAELEMELQRKENELAMELQSKENELAELQKKLVRAVRTLTCL